MSQEELLTVQEAARLSGLTDDAVRHAIQRGRVRVVMRYGRMLIEPAEFKRWRDGVRVGRPPKSKVDLNSDLGV